mmetsp:Transcript_24020/g.36606  ORF Transcript_24020/g.36606 Transcript_24020/m.36606 type:complete len:354 (-) Transcript_24020:51-1112(-)
MADVTDVSRSLSIMSLSEQDQKVMENVISGNWSEVREAVTALGSDLTLKLVNCISSVNPPQSVIVAIKRASSRIFSKKDEWGRYPIHYLCKHGAPTYSIVFAAQCYVAALEEMDELNKTPLEYLMTMPLEFCAEDKNEVIEELQRCHNLKCYDEKSKLPNQKALESWGHKIVLEEEMKCFMVIFIECARFENVENWEGCCLSIIAEEIKDQCYDVAESMRDEGKLVHVDPYRLVSNQFVIVAKTQSKESCDDIYQRLCLQSLASLTHNSIYLRLGCVYSQGIVGCKSLAEMVKEGEESQKKVKENLESAAVAVSMALNDVTGVSKINVSQLTESSLADYSTKDLTPDNRVGDR